ncbi:MAG TPA: YccF domain-containing protein [Opitutales bacterium]|nr:YccF domain-containing protein [Opitutales bacterium]
MSASIGPSTPVPMRTLGNILWHIPFLGFIDALIAFLLGMLLTVTVVAAPIGLGLIQFSKFLLLPYSQEMVTKSDLQEKTNLLWGTWSLLVRILYFPIGLIAALIVLVKIVGLCISIVGIPVAIVLAKGLGTFFNPVGKICVPISVAEEAERRRARARFGA